MQESAKNRSPYAFYTQCAFLGIHAMSTPCWSLLSILSIILYKLFSLNLLQIAVIVAIKPASALLSLYWSQIIHNRPDKIIQNLMGANFFRHIPLLFIRWNSPWLIITAYAIYMIFTRAARPAWMELFKQTLFSQKSKTMVSYATRIDYISGAAVTLSLSFILDCNIHHIKWLYLVVALPGLLSTILLRFVPPLASPYPTPHQPVPLKFPANIFKPWKESFRLVSTRKDFRAFQLGFMFGGAGLMIMHPAIPLFFVDTLKASFITMGIAISLCKGIGVIISSSFWTRRFQQTNIFQYCAFVCLLAALFPLLIISSSKIHSLTYFAYILYGIMQAGSELAWHMSGPIFSQKEDSSIFSMTNVLSVGIRGCSIPFIGSALLAITSSWVVLCTGTILSLLAATSFLIHGYQSNKKNL